MGVNLRDLVPKTQVNLRDLAGKSVAIDAYNALYQFLAIIRQPDGTPLKDSSGRVTSHLSGLLYRTSNLVEMGISVAYVFDGTPPALKEIEIKRRIKTKEEATVKYEKALSEGKTEEARTYAQATSRLKDYMEEDSKRLLDLLGIPWVQAPGEGEAQAAYITKRRVTNFCASQDYDSLLFGAPTLVRNVTISGRRKLPRKQLYVEVIPETIELGRVLVELGISYEQLVDVGILVGTDYNPEGVKGIGPKTALKLIREHGNLESLLQKSLEDVEFPVDPQRIRDVFLRPRVTDDYSLKWRTPDTEGVVDFLCRERDFSEDRVRRTLEKMSKGIENEKAKTTLDAFFG
ncbi:MAG TPA: flap endonuclease-1 [Candidatus Paceibacterota bacterium]|nr:flap endonuclease-1 [Candidatus Paceibacterota bacterium]